MSELPCDPATCAEIEFMKRFASPDPTRGRMMLLGSKSLVIEAMQDLDHIGIASICDWSDIIPAPNMNEVMTLLSCDYKQQS